MTPQTNDPLVQHAPTPPSVGAPRYELHATYGYSIIGHGSPVGGNQPPTASYSILDRHNNYAEVWVSYAHPYKREQARARDARRMLALLNQDDQEVGP